MECNSLVGKQINRIIGDSMPPVQPAEEIVNLDVGFDLHISNDKGQAVPGSKVFPSMFP